MGDNTEALTTQLREEEHHAERDEYGSTGASSSCMLSAPEGPGGKPSHFRLSYPNGFLERSSLSEQFLSSRERFMAEAETLTDRPDTVALAPAGHTPYIPDNVVMKEFTWSAVAIGSVLGIIFGASSLYLVLKVGMTVSASIPVAVLAITLFRAFSRVLGTRRATILENNVVQTAGSAGESIAFGVGVTMPALLLLGYNMDWIRIMVVAVLGGMLGILAMIPLRVHRQDARQTRAAGHALVPRGHGLCPSADLRREGGRHREDGLHRLRDRFPAQVSHRRHGRARLHAEVALDVRQPVSRLCRRVRLGVAGRRLHYRARTSAIMMSGAVLGYLVIIPLIAYVGQYAADQLVPPGKKLISEMNPRELRDNYLLFMGAGCVATAGIISMFRTMPMIVRLIRSGLGNMTVLGGRENGAAVVPRTENDMSMKTVLFGSLGLVLLLTVFLAGEVGLPML